MTIWLKQSTAATVKMGTFVDSTDGNTEETALTISQADIRLSKNGGAFAQTNNAAGATHDEKGMYGVPLDTTDTNTLGNLRVHIHESGALPVWQDFMVVPANVWDSMFGADKLQVDTVEVQGTTQTARDIGASVLLSSGTGTGQVKLSSGYVAPNWGDVGNPTTIVGLSGTTVKTATDVETDTQDIQGRLPAALVSGRMDSDTQAMASNVITSSVIAADAIGASQIAADAIGSSELAASAVTEIQSGLATSANQTTILSKLLKYFQLALRSDTFIATDNATELTAINADGGSGAGAYDNTVEGNERIGLLVDQIDSNVGTGGANLAFIPWNAAWDAQVQSEVQDAIEVNHLDHLIAVADPGGVAANSSFLAKLVSKSATPAFSSYDNTTDSLEAQRDNIGTNGAALSLAKTTNITGFNDLSTAQVNAEADTALADVGVTTTVTGRIDAAISTRATPAQVNAEVVDALATDTYAEPSSIPAATSSLKDKVGWLFALARNKMTQTSTTQTLRNDADSGNIATSSTSDDGTTATRGEWS